MATIKTGQKCNVRICYARWHNKKQRKFKQCEIKLPFKGFGLVGEITTALEFITASY